MHWFCRIIRLDVPVRLSECVFIQAIHRSVKWADSWHLSGRVQIFYTFRVKHRCSCLAPTCGSQSFPIWLWNMLPSCCQRVTRYLLHQTLEVIRAYATRPAKQQQMVNILDPRAFVMHTSQSRLSDSCFSASVQLLCNQARIKEITRRVDWREFWQKKLNYRCDVVNSSFLRCSFYCLILIQIYQKKEQDQNEVIHFCCFSAADINYCFSD